MTGASWALIGAAGAFGVADWVAVARADRRLEYVCKPATLLALIAVALTLDPTDGSQRGWFVAALALSLAGDVWLMLPRDLFVPGLGSFLLAHIAYVVGLVLEIESGAAVVVAAAPVLLAAATIGRRLVAGARAGPQPEVAVPVIAYVGAISAMVTCALATGDPVAGMGAVLFFASDALIGWTRFVQAIKWGRLAIIVTYHLGQAALVTSLVV